jgi:hypothetical protein
MKPKNHSIDSTIELAEAMSSTKIDRERGVIEGVLILTGEKVSRNKTLYTKKVLQEAVSRYEGAKMYLDHPANGQTVRSVRDFGGTYKNVRLDEGRFLRADLHLIPSESVRSTVIPIAESKPAGVGLSIRDRGHGREENGVFLVEGFAGKGPFSIDLVMEASVNETLFESTQGGGNDMDPKELKELLSKLSLEQLQESAPALVDAIRSAERTSVLKELEEKIKAGEDAQKLSARAKKQIALAESGLPTDVVAKIKTVIEADATSVEAAEAMVKVQKEILEAMKPASGAGKAKEPSVTGHGASKETTELSEGELPSEDDLARAILG